MCGVQVVRTLYDQHGILPFALEMYSGRLQQWRIALNPAHLTIPDITRVPCQIFVFARRRSDMDAIVTFMQRTCDVALPLAPTPLPTHLLSDSAVHTVSPTALHCGCYCGTVAAIRCVRHAVKGGRQLC